MKAQLLFKEVVLRITMLLLITTIFAQEVSFQGLGYLFYDGVSLHGEAYGVSYDGSVVVGVSSSIYDGIEVREAFRWTENVGLQGLGALSGSDFFSFARGVSEDGSVIIGYSRSPSSIEWEAFRWKEGEGMIGLGDLVSFDIWSESTGVSADGSIVVGRSYTIINEGFRWENGQMQSITEEGATMCEAWGISGDGFTIVGNLANGGIQQGFRWTDSEGMIGLGAPEGGYSIAFGTSYDGSVIVGIRDSPEMGREAFRWTEANGMIGLGHFPEGDFSEAKDVSNDGSIIVGWANEPDDHYAFIWTENEGMRNLQRVLENNYGLNLEGWTLTSANAISGDGSTIVGTGINPNGYMEAWRTTLPVSLSVDDFLAIEVSLYPNPTTGIVNLQINGVVESVKVYDVTGKVTIASLSLGEGLGERIINLSHFSSGMYFVEVTVDGQTSRHKVIKK